MFVLLLAALLCLGAGGASTTSAEFEYRAARIDNPLKGVIPEGPARHETFPHTLRYVQLSMARLMTGPDQFDWSLLDQQLQAIAMGGRHSVIRIYIDWPGRESGLPKYLIEAGVRTNVTPQWRQNDRPPAIVPDWEDPQLRAAIRNFIARFGQRYDGRPEIGFIEAGLLGVWGEWLQWNGSRPSVSAQREAIDAYVNAFHTTKILFRFPSQLTLQHSVGYHDDWFAGKKGVYAARFTEFGNPPETWWQTEPAGGRIFPEVQAKLWRNDPKVQVDDEFLRAAEFQHLTYLRLGTSFSNVKHYGQEKAILNLAQKLGYEFYVSHADIESKKRKIQVSVEITNTGAAPFYYRWPIELAISNEDKLLKFSKTDWDIRTIQPEKAAQRFSHEFDLSGLRAGDYTVLLSAVNPVPNGPPVSFANVKQDATVGGWLTLGSISVAP